MLGGGHGVRGGQQATDDAELLVQQLDQRSGAIGGARRVRDDLHAFRVPFEVYAFDERRRVFAGCADYHLLRARLHVFLNCLNFVFHT